MFHALSTGPVVRPPESPFAHPERRGIPSGPRRGDSLSPFGGCPMSSQTNFAQDLWNWHNSAQPGIIHTVIAEASISDGTKGWGVATRFTHFLGRPDQIFVNFHGMTIGYDFWLNWVTDFEVYVRIKTGTTDSKYAFKDLTLDGDTLHGKEHATGKTIQVRLWKRRDEHP